MEFVTVEQRVVINPRERVSLMGLAATGVYVFCFFFFSVGGITFQHICLASMGLPLVDTHIHTLTLTRVFFVCN